MCNNNVCTLNPEGENIVVFKVLMHLRVVTNHQPIYFQYAIAMSVLLLLLQANIIRY